jgi:DNA-binding transcriptional regulator YdaS (Cro superfamily)
MVAARVANLKHGQTARGRNSDLSQPVVTQPEAAKMLNVSRDSVNKAAKIEREAIPEVTKAVERGQPSQPTAEPSANWPEVSTSTLGGREPCLNSGIISQLHGGGQARKSRQLAHFKPPQAVHGGGTIRQLAGS